MEQNTMNLRKRIIERLEVKNMARQLLVYLILPGKFAKKVNQQEQDKLAELKKLLELD